MEHAGSNARTPKTVNAAICAIPSSGNKRYHVSDFGPHGPPFRLPLLARAPYKWESEPRTSMLNLRTSLSIFAGLLLAVACGSSDDSTFPDPNATDDGGSSSGILPG